MFDEIKEKQFVLQLFNLEYSDVQDVSCIRAGNKVIIDITFASDPVPCPVCRKTLKNGERKSSILSTS